MIITVKANIPEKELERIKRQFEEQGFQINDSCGANYHILGLIGDTTTLDEKSILADPYISQVTRIAVPYKQASRQFHPEDTIVDVNGIKIGGKEKIVVIGGPCSVEGQEQISRIAKEVKEAGADMLRGGAYKPRTSPYAFQGLGFAGIMNLEQAKKETGMPIVSELMDSEQLEEFVEHVDIIQIGARNMQNFSLLKAVGKTKKPVLLKRGLANTIEEWIMSAEYVLAQGNPNVILCERGIRTFEKYTRNTLDLSVIPIIKEKTHLPIIIDPSHATGDWKLVEAMSLAAVVAGADGLMIEVHDHPECAWSDGAQSVKPKRFKEIIEKCRKAAKIVGRELG